MATKKVSSPTGKASKVNPDLDDAMKGKGGKRPPAPKKAAPATKGKGSNTSKDSVTAGGMVKGGKRKAYLDSL